MERKMRQNKTTSGERIVKDIKLDLLAPARPATRLLLETFFCTKKETTRDFRKAIASITVSRAQKWRHALARSNAKGGRGYACPSCKGRLTLVYQVPDKFHLRHVDQKTSCPLQDDRRRSEYRKDVEYARAAEGAEHSKMRQDILGLLNLDPAFTDVGMGRLFAGKQAGWRQPDLNALWGDQRMAFELQLSSTYLEELVRRREVYRDHEVPMLWVMRDFDPYNPKLPQVDTITELGGLALCADSASIEASRKAKELRLWAVQFVHHDRDWARRLIGLDDLTFDLERATVKLDQPPVPAPVPDPAPDPVVVAEARRLLESLVRLQAKDFVGPHPNWDRLLTLYPDIGDEIRKRGWGENPNPWFLRLVGAVMMGQSGEVEGFQTQRLQHAGDIFAENAWEIFATFIRVLREFGFEEKLYAEPGGEGLRRKAAGIRKKWHTSGRRPFKTKKAERELVRRAWPELAHLVIEPPI